MIRVDLGGRAASLAAVVVICGSIVACGSGGTGSASSAPGISAAQTGGAPLTSATVGHPYSFQPTVSGASGALKFSIANKPAWANFDASTGSLTGTPGATQVGTYGGITISYVGANTSVTLPPFSIVVAEGNPQSNVTLSWQPPTENADGSPLVDLKGYKVHYGASSKSYSDSIQVANPGLTTYVVQNLAAGKYYFAVTAYNSAGQESSLSSEVATQVD